MIPQAVQDISYFIGRKQQRVAALQSQGKDTSALQAEIVTLENIAAVTEDCFAELYQLQRQVAELQSQLKKKAKYNLIAAAVRAARQEALHFNQWDYAAALWEIEEHPKVILTSWKETAESILAALPVAEELEQKLDYYNIEARCKYEAFCKSNGLNPTKRLTIWKSKTDNKNKNKN